MSSPGARDCHRPSLPLFNQPKMPKAAAGRGTHWCIACKEYHLSASIVARHEAAQVAPGIAASAIVQGALDKHNIAGGREHKRRRQGPGPPQEDSGNIPGGPDTGPSTEFGNKVPAPVLQDPSPTKDPFAVPAAVLSSAAMAWTQSDRVWIGEVLDESEIIDPTTGAPEVDEEEEEFNPCYYEPEDDDEGEKEAWEKEMEDALLREMEDIGT